MSIRTKKIESPSLTDEASWREKQKEKNRVAIELLQSWCTGDAEEQRDTWEQLGKALDEDRLSDRALFPCDG